MQRSRPEVRLRDARAADAGSLSAVARAAKAHWRYRQELLDAWAQDLTITAPQIGASFTRIAEIDEAPVAFMMMTGHGSDRILEHLWVLPERIGHGIGRLLFEEACARARADAARRLLIDAEPHATGFYLRCGASRVGEIAAPIAGDPLRARPQLVKTLGD